jgi:aminopeptidase N
MGLWRGLAAGMVLALGGLAVVRTEAQRLPGGVQPERYTLTITPDLAKARFAGRETIEVVLDAPATAITLNAAEIEFGSVKAYRWPSGLIIDPAVPKNWKTQPAPHYDLTKLDEDPQTAVVTLDPDKEQAMLTFAQALPAGRVTLEIEYTGILNNKLRGFYLSKTKLRSYGVTQFEATDARRAFPCFDEPALKATFDVTLIIDAGDTAISNTRIVSDTPGPLAGKHTIAFAPTPKMSTYLVAWLVGDFQCSAGKSDGVAIRVCATPDKVGLTKFAVDAAKWDLHYYDKYFGIKYPLKKLDLIAIPDFEAGAMENFGCITFRETELLVDAKNGPLPAKKEVAETVAHEMSHQWFGDLVTPEWWDNLWLNEGFATWMETKAPAKWQPRWEYAQDAAQDKNRTMDVDAGKTTRPIYARAETPAEINEMFDDIAYGKAGEVIAMVENWVGEDVFRKGVQAYLAAHLYANATGEDFWGTMTRTSGLPVDAVMRSFIEQSGVPEVVLGVSGGNPTHDDKAVMNGAPGDDASTKATAGGKAFIDGAPMAAVTPVTQSRFFLSAPALDAKLEAWAIPVCFAGASCRLLTPQTATLDVPAAHPFVYANAQDKGYYRTAYTPAELTAIVAHAETGLTPAERIGLLGDRWSLMRAGQGTVGEFLDLVLALKQDQNAPVMDSAMGRVRAIVSRIASEEDGRRLDAVVRREFDPVYAALGGAGQGGAGQAGPQRHESYDHATLRGTLFEALGNAKDPEVLAEAEKVARELFAGEKPSDPMIADAAVALATVNGDTEMYERMMKVSRDATDPDLKEAALHALTRFQAPELVTRTLDYAVSDGVRSQDSWTLIALLLERRPTQDQAWEFVRKNWDAILRKSTESSGARIVEAVGEFCTEEKRDQVSSFFREHPVESSRRTLARTIDNINDCIHLRAAQEPELRGWLDKQTTR